MAANRSHAARADLRVAAVDLFLPAERRLTDQQRALTSGVLNRLIGTIELALCQQLVEASSDKPELRALLASLANRSGELARPALEASSVLQDADLIAALLRRAEEYRIALAIRSSDTQLQPDPLDALVRNSDPRVARGTTEYVVAESRRYDRFREPLLSHNDMQAELAYRLFWCVAAALRSSLLQDHQIEPGLLDDALERSVRYAMADHVEAHGAAALALRVAERLNELGRLSNDLLGRLIEHGHVVLFTAGLAVRGGIAYDIAWQVITDPGRMSLAVLLRALDVERVVASLIVRLLQDTGSTVLRPSTGALATFEQLDSARAQSVLRYWQLDAGYRAAIDALGDSRF